MPPHMSFGLTIGQIENETKTLTTRDADTWQNLKPSDIVIAVDRVMGFKKGEHPRELKVIRIVNVWLEPLDAITPENVIAEGFSDWTPEQFVAFYCKKRGSRSDQIVRRIRFEYVRPEIMSKAAPTPAILILVKSGEHDKWLFFESHLDALDTGKEWREAGWKWEMRAVDVFRAGTRPQIEQPRLF